MEQQALIDPCKIIFRKQFGKYCTSYAHKKEIAHNLELLTLNLGHADKDPLHPFHTAYAKEISKINERFLPYHLYKAAKIGNIFEASLLIKRDKYIVNAQYDINPKGASFTGLIDSPIQIAIKKNQIPMVKYLISVGANVNCNYMYSGTALYTAVLANNVEAAKIVVEAGAEVNVERAGAIPLNYAAESGNLEMVHYLLSLKNAAGHPKVDINARGSRGIYSFGLCKKGRTFHYSSGSHASWSTYQLEDIDGQFLSR